MTSVFSNNMDIVFFRLHTRIASFTLYRTTATFRSVVETVFLVGGILSFCLLVCLHFHFVVGWGAENCLAQYISRADMRSGSYHIVQITVSAEASEVGLNIVGDGDDDDGGVCSLWQEADGGVLCDVDTLYYKQKPQFRLPKTASPIPPNTYLFSLHSFYLQLPVNLRPTHSVRTLLLTLPSSNPSCLGDALLQQTLSSLVGYDTAVLNWVLGLGSGDGHLYNLRTGETSDLSGHSQNGNDKAAGEDISGSPSPPSSTTLLLHLRLLVFKLCILLATLFLFFTVTTLVSFTLRETQDRMLRFTRLLQSRIRNRLPIGTLVVLHVAESLVFVPIMIGVLFFLFEFFGDHRLAVHVLSVVWMCEVYSVVCMRTSACVQFFPRVFFLYFTLFHVYFFSCPFGFSFLALGTTGE